MQRTANSHRIIIMKKYGKNKVWYFYEGISMTIFSKSAWRQWFHIRKEKEGGRNFHKVSNKRLQSWDCLFKLTTDLISILFKLCKKKTLSLSLLKLFVVSSVQLGLSEGFKKVPKNHDNKKVVFQNTWGSLCSKLNSKHVFFL